MSEARLRTEFLHCLAEQPRYPTLVLLHGWASDKTIWRPSLAILRRHADVLLVDLPGVGDNRHCWNEDAKLRLQDLLSILPNSCVLIGWSLGGMVARELASRAEHSVVAVVTLAANWHFCEIESDDWPGMPDVTARAFAEGVSENPAKTLKRFDALQMRGAENLRELGRELPGLLPLRRLEDNLAGWLDALYQMDQRDLRLPQAQFALFAQEDELVPFSCVSNAPAGVFSQCLPGSHLLPLADAKSVWQPVFEFLDRQPGGEFRQEFRDASAKDSGVDKRAMRRSFSRAAESYDSVADLQREVADRLLQDAVVSCRGDIHRVVDLGCGTGYSLPGLQSAFTEADVIAIDIAEGMAAKARQRADTSALVADAEDLPLTAASVDLLFSSMALQWCEQPQYWLRELFRCLKPGGQAVISTVGDASLLELRRAWQVVDNYVHVNRFCTEQVLRIAIKESGLTLALWREDARCRHHESFKDIARELKGLGARNVNSGRPGGLTGRKRLAALTAAYEAQRVAQGLPLSWQIWHLVIRKPEEGQS